MLNSSKEYSLTPAQAEKYLSLYIREDDSCLEQVGELFSTKEEAHWWASLTVLDAIYTDTKIILSDIDELLEVA